MEWNVALPELTRWSDEFWASAGNSKVFAFHGDMGAGKTTIISALCRARGVEEHLSSPTFSIINAYHTASGEEIFHLDLYRLKNAREAAAAGVEDCLESGAICFVEWPERAPEMFDGNTMHVYISVQENGLRKIRLEGFGVI